MIPGVRHSPRWWPRAQHSPRWQQEPQTSTQILAVTGPQIRTWPPNTVQAWSSPPSPPGRGRGRQRWPPQSAVSPDSNLTLGCRYCHRWWPRPQASALPSVATGAMDNDADPGFGRPRDPAQVWMSPQPRVAARVTQISFLCWPGRLCHPRHWGSSLPLVVTGATNANTKGCCSKATHSDTSLGSSPGLSPQDVNRSAFASFSYPPHGYEHLKSPGRLTCLGNFFKMKVAPFFSF